MKTFEQFCTLNSVIPTPEIKEAWLEMAAAENEACTTETINHFKDLESALFRMIGLDSKITETDALAEEAYYDYILDEYNKRNSLVVAHESHTSCPICGSIADFNTQEQACYNVDCEQSLL